MPIVSRWTRKLTEQQHEQWGSGWYNVNTGQNITGEGIAHVDTIVANCQAFNFCDQIPPGVERGSDEYESLLNQWDGNYMGFYRAGWMRYLWALEHGDHMVAGSATPEVLAAAWSAGVISGLYQEFNANQSYWNYDGQVADLPKNVTVGEHEAGVVPPEIERWFMALSGEDAEISDIRRRAGL